MKPPVRVVVMGVSGCGKSQVGQLLAQQLDALFLDGDDFHSQANRAKMAGGAPLSDDDRVPWLDTLARELQARERVVLACSALRRTYRDRLRAAAGVRFVFLDGGFELILGRMQQRADHFMPPALLCSQFETLERPGEGDDHDEADVVRVSIEPSLETVVDSAARRLVATC